MPQMTKGGKYIFGWSRIRVNGELIFPRMAVDEYNLQEETYIYIVFSSHYVFTLLFKFHYLIKYDKAYPKLRQLRLNFYRAY